MTAITDLSNPAGRGNPEPRAGQQERLRIRTGSFTGPTSGLAPGNVQANLVILPKVLDEILTNGGSFSIREINIGKQRHDASYACIDVFGPSPEIVDALVRRLRQHGAEVVEQKDVTLVPAPTGSRT